MGCVASKDGAAPVTPALDSSVASGNLEPLGHLEAAANLETPAKVETLEHLETSREFQPSPSLWNGPRLSNYEFSDQPESGESEKKSSAGDSVASIPPPRNLSRCNEGEQVAAGWPAWLSCVAGEAIRGWAPLKAEAFEKLEKIGQGTYSNVFRACEIDTGRIVALKKVRFDNFEPESVRFMAREILILRKLDHPNIVKLEGIITSRLSCSIYLVFEYMEHDLAGLSSSPDIKFSESQIKCYMHQLLLGLNQCHSRGIMHRDIKCANLLVNNEGILKIADFGLANILNPEEKQPLTSRVVTLWYRPPELLLGSVDYDATVDLWSVGCVFAELFLGKPILQGRTEVEQIHKIFKLCGSPPGEFWKKTKLPQATVIKSQHAYENCLYRTFEFLPDSAFKLLETFLSIESTKRGTAVAALNSEYFKTKPYACEPSSLPKYNPSKEIDAKFREDSIRSVNGRFFDEGTKGLSKSHKLLQELSDLGKASHKEALRNAIETNRSGTKEALHDSRKPDLPLPNMKSQEERRRMKQIPRNPQSGPMHVPATGFSCAKKPKDAPLPIKSQNRFKSRQGKFSLLDPTLAQGTLKSNGEEHGGTGYAPFSNSKVQPYESTKEEMLRRWIHPEFQDSVYSFGDYDSHDAVSKNRIMDYKDQGVEFSGPVLLQSKKVDEFLEKHEEYIRRATRKSWFQKAQKQQRY
ncbi:protein IMPAIRED IN BABA-INDUCED STERILITY 1-like [Zingiber officinale]|uniref:[RNA-polymerase]-subunit kinase n=1 Tax=Zingiber officinale TaxID=94328 RepID=A0A8J5EYW8_ZINOF|nr:protein IMPAIRED IN BABA-INDUCED STERILITY 1-like [Zingiber officinale]KAG6477592.1 hypothetical protein ZIOFF_066859 [Zingiber officinale]